MKHTKNSAFTLVELIVVIVILAILATIAFLSFGSQSSSARDSTRLSDLGSISKGLMVYQSTKSTYPSPDKPVNIVNSGVTNVIGQQGVVGSSVKSNIKAGADGFVDPLHKTEYTYIVNASKNKFQLLAFLENNPSLALNINFGLENKASAFDYLNTFPYVKGDNMGVIVVSSGAVGSLTPVQDITNNTGIVMDGVVDVATVLTTSSGVQAVLNNGVGTSTTNVTTVTNLPGLYGNQYPDCDTPDISLSNGQTWAACNVGSKIAGITNASDGYYFKWGNNNFYLTGGEINTLIIENSGATDWLNGGQGPCAGGYHVPTINEWKLALENISGLTCPTIGGNGVKTIYEKLKLPAGGCFNEDGSEDAEYGVQGKYWSSNPAEDGEMGNLHVDYKGDVYCPNQQRHYAPSSRLSVRCIKN